MTQVLFVGSGDLEPAVGGETASFIINDRHLIDCGWCAALEMRRYGITPLDLDTLFITHCHHDHVMGLPALLFYRGMRQPSGVTRPPLRIYGPAGEMPEAVENARRFLRADRFPGEWAEPALHPLSPGDRVQTSTFRIEVDSTLHGVPGLAYRFEDTATGAVVAFTGDTGWRPQLAHLSRGAGLLIHDATLRSDPEPSPGSSHASARQAAEIARRAGVGRLVLIHYSRPDGPARLDAARAVFPETVLAEEGLRIDVPA